MTIMDEILDIDKYRREMERESFRTLGRFLGLAKMIDSGVFTNEQVVNAMRQIADEYQTIENDLKDKHSKEGIDND